MVDPESENAPLFVWSFPVIRRLQKRQGVLNMAVQSFIESEDSDSEKDFSQEVRVQSDSDTDTLDDLENEIDELDSNSEMLFSESEPDAVISITEDGFSPQEVTIGIGDTVRWVNNTDTTSRISSVENASFNSSILDPGGMYSETFYSPKTITYKDPTSGDSERGKIIVSTDAQPSEENPVPFDESTSSVRSMDKAVSDKEDKDLGF